MYQPRYDPIHSSAATFQDDPEFSSYLSYTVSRTTLHLHIHHPPAESKNAIYDFRITSFALAPVPRYLLYVL
ncbi:hypothetical protein PG993_003464 [Apiospora rasikravindrae]|uniref:Uncharacterized protein n=1 Tax=Apiospora rasikravindrae TaxID=990691 RepID=A0ABR1TZM1_9PEZI